MLNIRSEGLMLVWFMVSICSQWWLIVKVCFGILVLMTWERQQLEEMIQSDNEQILIWILIQLKIASYILWSILLLIRAYYSEVLEVLTYYYFKNKDNWDNHVKSNYFIKRTRDSTGTNDYTRTRGFTRTRDIRNL